MKKKEIKVCIINNDMMGYYKQCSGHRYDIGYHYTSGILHKLFKLRSHLTYLEVEDTLDDISSLDNFEGAHYVKFKHDENYELVHTYLATNSFSKAVDIVRGLEEYELEYKKHKICLVKYNDKICYYTPSIDANIFETMKNMKDAIDLKIEYTS